MKTLIAFSLFATVVPITSQCSDDSQQREVADRAPDPLMVPAAPISRFTITRVQTVYDDLAYDGERGVYLIHDNQTGEEWVGVSGIGITELGSHGKGQQDER